MDLGREKKELIQSTFKKVAIQSDAVGERFYQRLFEIRPSLKNLFDHADMKQQIRKFMQVIGASAMGIERLDALMPEIKALAHRHIGYGVKKEDFTAMGDALLWTFQASLGDDFTPEEHEAWQELYAFLSSTMIDTAFE